MDPNLKLFFRQWLGVVFASLVPVVLTAFMAVPLALGKHPGEAGPATGDAPQARHMT